MIPTTALVVISLLLVAGAGECARIRYEAMKLENLWLARV